jgi:hypothetical protein
MLLLYCWINARQNWLLCTSTDKAQKFKGQNILKVISYSTCTVRLLCSIYSIVVVLVFFGEICLSLKHDWKNCNGNSKTKIMIVEKVGNHDGSFSSMPDALVELDNTRIHNSYEHSNKVTHCNNQTKTPKATIRTQSILFFCYWESKARERERESEVKTILNLYTQVSFPR